MVIDKTTGKGCAWSITSKIITRKLIDENIVDKLIYRKPRKSTYDLLRVVRVDYGDNRHNVYVTTQRSDELTEEPLWIPSFIDAEIWERAVSRFCTFERLDKNVEKYLLPEMEEYLQSISDADLVAVTKDFLIEHGVINAPISQRAGNTYYFNKNEVYSFDRKSEMFPYDKQLKYNVFKAEYEACLNINVWRKAVSQFEVGMTLKECVEIFLQTELAHNLPQEPSPTDRLVQYIARPIYERSPGNSNSATFDHIRMTVGLPRYQFNSWKALQNEVKKYQHEIYQRAVQKLEKDRGFKKYGIPINFLKLSNVILLRDFSMELIFELKEQKTDPALNKVTTIFESEESENGKKDKERGNNKWQVDM